MLLVRAGIPSAPAQGMRRARPDLWIAERQRQVDGHVAPLVWCIGQVDPGAQDEDGPVCGEAGEQGIDGRKRQVRDGVGPLDREHRPG